jgi:hypothetical protein
VVLVVVLELLATGGTWTRSMTRTTSMTVMTTTCLHARAAVVTPVSEAALSSSAAVGVATVDEAAQQAAAGRCLGLGARLVPRRSECCLRPCAQSSKNGWRNA